MSVINSNVQVMHIVIDVNIKDVNIIIKNLRNFIYNDIISIQLHSWAQGHY